MARRAALLLLLVLVASCSVSPQPLPPPGLSRSEIRIEVSGAGQLRVSGAAGAVLGEAETMEIVNLGNASGSFLRVSGDVAPDGSFTVDLPGVPADSLRIQAYRDDEERSEALDVTASPDGTLADPLRIACMTVDPPLEIDLGAVPSGGSAQATLVVTNGCTVGTGFDGIALLDGTSWATAETLGDLPLGASTTVTVTFSPAAAGPSFDVVRLLFQNGTGQDFRAVSLRGSGE